MVSSLMFVIPFFFIVGFDKDGTAEKFFWYWLYQALYVMLMVFLGHLLSTALPSAAVGNGKRMNSNSFYFLFFFICVCIMFFFIQWWRVCCPHSYLYFAGS